MASIEEIGKQSKAREICATDPVFQQAAETLYVALASGVIIAKGHIVRLMEQVGLVDATKYATLWRNLALSDNANQAIGISIANPRDLSHDVLPDVGEIGLYFDPKAYPKMGDTTTNELVLQLYDPGASTQTLDTIALRVATAYGHRLIPVSPLEAYEVYEDDIVVEAVNVQHIDVSTVAASTQLSTIEPSRDTDMLEYSDDLEFEQTMKKAAADDSGLDSLLAMSRRDNATVEKQTLRAEPLVPIHTQRVPKASTPFKQTTITSHKPVLAITREREAINSDVEEMFVRFRVPLEKFIFRLVGNREQAFDLTQDVFIKAYRAYANGTTVAAEALPTWLYRIASNAAKDALRRRRLIAWIPLSVFNEDRGVGAGIPMSGFEQTNDDELPSNSSAATYGAATNAYDGARFEQHTADREVVQTVLDKLPDKYRAVLLLYEHEGFSCAEIGEMLSLSPSAIKVRLVRARDIFIKLYNQETGENRQKQ